MGPGQRRHRSLLLATDLTESSDPAANEALDLARELGASLLAVSVIDTSPRRLPASLASLRVDQVRERLSAEAQDLVARGHRFGVPVRFLIWRGDPGPSIIDAANAEEVDLIVVGSHRRGAVGRLFMGSVSSHVLRHARQPVLVVADHGATS